MNKQIIPKAIALVIIDLQRDFLDPNMPSRVGSWNKAFCVRGVRKLIAHARKNEWSVIHVGTKHESTETLPHHHRLRNGNIYCENDSLGCDFVVKPENGDIVGYKTLYSAFNYEDLATHLNGIKDIIFAGVATDCCIMQSIFDADRQGYHGVIPIEAVSASSADAFAPSLVSIAKSAGDVVDIADLLKSSEVVALPLEPKRVRDHAENWYNYQKSIVDRMVDRLGEGDMMDLESVLQHLETR